MFVNNCAYKMRTSRIQSDVKHLLFDCLLHQLGCCYARSLQAPSTRTRVNLQPREHFCGYKNYRVHTYITVFKSFLHVHTYLRVNLKTLMKHDLNTLGKRRARKNLHAFGFSCRITRGQCVDYLGSEFSVYCF